MKIIEILKNIEYVSCNIPIELRDRTINDLCHDSRIAEPTCLFFCKKGALADGHVFAENAYDKGARFFVAERKIDVPDDAAVIIVKDADLEMRKLSKIFYKDPSSRISLIGITGTKGKTTTALSIYNILCAAGISAGYIGTNGIFYRDTVIETSNTTPDCVELQKALCNMIACGVSVAVIEVSSQALWQERIYGISFHTCVFTNLYEDHIGGFEHPDFEHYRSCKRKLFTDYNVKNIIINDDSPDSRYMINGANYESLCSISARGNMKADIYAQKAQKAKKGIRPGVSFDLCCSERVFCDVFVPMPGLYSVENALLCFAVCRSFGLSLDFIVEKLSTLSIKGRFETVELETRPNSLFIIDYAHNGASLTAVLKALREYAPRRIICLFGSVGGRTFKRRIDLAHAANDNADVIIITTDNPDFEDEEDAVNDIYRHISDTEKPVYLIPDRKAAIFKAYELAGEGDYVLLAGKGHETYQLIRGERVPFSEITVLKKAESEFIYTIV